MDGNRNLFWKLLEPEHPKAEAFSRKLMGNRDDGDDLYQDALVLALTKFSSLRKQSSFRPWLYRILINTFKNRMRQPWWKRQTPLTREIEESTSGAGGNPTAQNDARRWLETALSALSAKERALITLFELEGWSVAELAGMYGRAPGAIKTRLSRARAKMRDALVRRTLSAAPAATEKGIIAKTDSKRLNSRTSKPIVSEAELCVATKSGAD